MTNLHEIDWPPVIGFLVLMAAAMIAAVIGAHKMGRAHREAEDEERDRERRQLREAAQRHETSI